MTRANSYIQWYNENEGRSYPVHEGATRVSNDGRTLPDDILVDFGLMVPPEQADIRLSAIRVTPGLVTLGISSSTSGLFVGTFARSEIEPYVSYPLTGLVDNVSGWVAFGNHTTYGVEDYRFDTYEQAGLEDRVVHVIDVLPVTKIIRLGGNRRQAADSLVKLVAGQGMVIERDEVDPQKIILRLDPDMMNLYVGPCNQVALTDVCGVPPMRSINGVCPDENGRITIRFE